MLNKKNIKDSGKELFVCSHSLSLLALNSPHYAFRPLLTFYISPRALYSSSLFSRFALSPRVLCSPSSRFPFINTRFSLSCHALCVLLPCAFPSPTHFAFSFRALFLSPTHLIWFLLPRAFTLSFALCVLPPRDFPLYPRALRSLLAPRTLHSVILCTLFSCSFGALITLTILSSIIVPSRRALHSLLALSVAPEYHLSFIFLQLPHRPISAYQPQPINATLTIPPS